MAVFNLRAILCGLLLGAMLLHAEEQTGTYWLIGPSAVERGADIATAGLKN